MITVADLVSKFGLHAVAEKKLSDHSVVTAEIEMYDMLSSSAQATVDLDKSTRQCTDASPNEYPSPPRHYRNGNS